MRIVPSKLILFGEYALLKGGNALGIPLPNFTGQLTLANSKRQFAVNSHLYLRKYLEWIKDNTSLHSYIDVAKMEDLTADGLWFDSNIPLNSGLGSSGALVAAIIHEFGKKHMEEVSLPQLRNILASFEGFFHGTSSGIDPLLTYLNQPILIKGNGEIKKIQINSSKEIMEIIHFLLPVKGNGETEKLVGVFNDKYKVTSYSQVFNSEYMRVNNNAIAMYLSGSSTDFWNVLLDLSLKQLQFFAEMIDKETAHLIREGISTQKFGLKLCGSGGGGYALGFAKSKQDVLNRFPDAILLNL